MRTILICILLFCSNVFAADFTRGNGTAASTVKIFRGNGTTAEEVSLYRGDGTISQLIVSPSGQYAVDDDFSSNTFSNYTLILNTPSYDAVNLRMKGSTNTYQNSSLYSNTSLSSSDQEIIADVLYNAASSVTGIVFRCNGDGSSSTGWIVKFQSTSATLSTFSGSTITYYTGISYVGNTWASNASHKIKVSVTGTSLSLYIDWTDDGDFEDANETMSSTVTATPTGDYIGAWFFQNGISVWVDNLLARAL